MATIHPISRYVKSFRYGKPLYRRCVGQKASTARFSSRIVELPMAGVKTIKSINQMLLETLSNTSLNIAGLVVTTVRTPPFNLPGVSTREFYMSQWRVDADSIMPGVPRLLYCTARIPDSVGIVLACSRRRTTTCDKCSEPCNHK